MGVLASAGITKVRQAGDDTEALDILRTRSFDFASVDYSWSSPVPYAGRAVSVPTCRSSWSPAIPSGDRCSKPATPASMSSLSNRSSPLPSSNAWRGWSIIPGHSYVGTHISDPIAAGLNTTVRPTSAAAAQTRVFEGAALSRFARRLKVSVRKSSERYEPDVTFRRRHRLATRIGFAGRESKSPASWASLHDPEATSTDNRQLRAGSEITR